MKFRNLFRALAVILSASVLCAYEPPIGIPDPFEVFGWEIDRPTPTAPASWSATPTTATANYYYVDNRPEAGGTDSANPYGHPDRPRVSIPEGELQPGTFVYINGGIYTTPSGGRYDWHGAGTSEQPIWITGNPSNRPVIQRFCQIAQNGNTSYLVFENVEISGNSAAGLRVGPSVPNPMPDNHVPPTVNCVLVRNILRIGTQTIGEEGGISTSVSQSGEDPLPGASVKNVVIYNSEVREISTKTHTGDRHGIEIGFYTDGTWILNNHVHNVNADSVQSGHYANYTNRTIKNLYIGGNEFNSNGENGIDIKVVLGFVISQNHIHGPFDGREQGWALVMHGGAEPSLYHPRDGAVIFNNIHTASGGIYTSLSSGCDNIEIIGNTIWDIKRTPYTASPDSINGYCMLIGGTTPGANSTIRIVDNTLHDYDRGLVLWPSVGDTYAIHGNIFSGRTAETGNYEVELHGSTALAAYAGVSLDYNLYTSSPAIYWQGAARTLDFIRSTAMLEAHAVVDNPLFVDAAGGNFHLGAGSPAIDASVEGPVGNSAYTAYQASPVFGEPIRFDIARTARPVDGVWDIGAHESALPPNEAPTSLTVGP